MDPERQNPAWETLGPLIPDPPGFSTMKAKRKAEFRPQVQTARGKQRRIGTLSEDEDEVEVVAPGRRKRAQKRDKDPPIASGQRKGLEAEDDYGPEAEKAEDEDKEGEEAAVEDSEFEESDDGAGDDYNAENYFDAGDDDADFDEAAGDDDGGTFLT